LRAPRLIAALLIAVCVLPAAACTSEDKPEPPVDAAPTPGATSSPTETATATVTTAARRFSVQIQSGRVVPAPGRFQVRQGDSVIIEVSSDVADTVHLHGYDIEVELEPGTPAELQFTADRAGLYDVETHDTHLTLFQLQVS